MPAPLRDVNFAADDRLDSARLGFLIKRFCGKKIPVIRDSHGGHFAPRRLIHHFLQIASSIQKAIVRVQMQMNESRGIHAGRYSNRARRF
jgi:hypothetical protein